jgi:hypothetical protein
VEATGKLLGQRSIHHPVPFDAALSCERRGDDADPEVRLAARQCAGVTVMEVGFVRNAQAFRVEGFGEFVSETRPYRHDAATSLRETVKP